MRNQEPNFQLGNKLRDTITGFSGIATSRVEYLTGCIQYGIAPKCTSDGKIQETQYFDEQRLVFEEDGIATTSKPTGGPQRDCPPC